MRNIFRQLLVTITFLGGWVLGLMLLFLCHLPLPHTHAFTQFGRMVGYDPYPKAHPTAHAPAVSAAKEIAAHAIGE